MAPRGGAHGRRWAPRSRSPRPSRRENQPIDANLAPVAQGLGRVLVVDDDEVIRQLIAVNLTLEGFDVATAVDGQDCLDKVVAIDPDVITLDVMMPRLDGWVTASQLRRNPDTSEIKVVLITARAQEDDKTRGKQIGVDAYLTKPFDPLEMIRVVRELAGHGPGRTGDGGPQVLERVVTRRGELVLRKSGAEFEIISNGVFLMDTRDGRSERLMVTAALARCPAATPQIM